MIDHKSTAQELERIVQTTKIITQKIGTPAAERAYQDTKENLLGIADWHLEQHSNQQAQLKRMRRFKKATNRVFPTLSKQQTSLTK